MYKNINVVIPAAGKGSRFSQAGWKKPKPFIDVNGLPMISRVIKNVTPEDSFVNLLFNVNDIENNQSIVNALSKSSQSIIKVDKITEGTACTVLLAREQINNDRPLLIANSDQLVDFNVNNFIKDCYQRNLDGSILVFKDIYKDPKWSFAKINKAGHVEEVAEKKPISDLATVGIYFFTKGSSFVNAAIDMIVNNDRVNNEFYTCPVYNYMIKNSAKIGIYEIDQNSMHGLGTPDDLESYLSYIDAPESSHSPK